MGWGRTVLITQHSDWSTFVAVPVGEVAWWGRGQSAWIEPRARHRSHGAHHRAHHMWRMWPHWHARGAGRGPTWWYIATASEVHLLCLRYGASRGARGHLLLLLNRPWSSLLLLLLLLC